MGSRGPSPITVFLYLLMLLTLAAAVLEFYGPARGWLEHVAAMARRHRQLNNETEPPPTDAFEGSDLPDFPLPTELGGLTDGGTETESPSFERLFKQFYDEELDKLTLPEIGRMYKVRLRGGRSEIGRLLERDERALVLEITNGKTVRSVTYKALQLHPMAQRKFFPETEARTRATYRAQHALANPRLQTPPENAPAPDAGPDIVSQGDIFDVTPGKTPAALRRSTDEFGNWLKRQQKRLDGKLVDRIYAKGGEGRAVLYLVTVPGFSSIESSIRHQIVEVAWRFWRERCEENGNISAAEKAHLVVLNAKLKVIGGSGRADGSKLWVAE